jgi:outer membrane protein assembly factor BamB
VLATAALALSVLVAAASMPDVSRVVESVTAVFHVVTFEHNVSTHSPTGRDPLFALLFELVLELPPHALAAITSAAVTINVPTALFMGGNITRARAQSRAFVTGGTKSIASDSSFVGAREGACGVRERGRDCRTVSLDGRSRAAAMAVIITIAVAGCSWPQFRYDPGHTGFNRLELRLGATNVTGLHVKWTAPGGVSPPAVAGGIVFDGAGTSLRALDARTGTLRWSVPTPAVFAGVSDGLVVTCTGSVGMKAYDALTGGFHWSQPTVECDGVGFTIANGVVYVENGPFGLAAFDAMTGTQRWSTTPCPASQPAPGTPTFSDGRLFVTCTGEFPPPDPVVLSLDAATGEQLWSTPLGVNQLNATPAVADGVVYVTNMGIGVNGSTPPGKVFALDARTGSLRWTATIPVFTGAWAPAVADGRVYALTDDGVLRAFATTDGSPLWTATADAPGNFDSPSVANGVVYTAGVHGLVQAFDAASGAKLFETNVGGQIFGGNAVVAGGMLYVPTEQNGLFAFAP